MIKDTIYPRFKDYSTKDKKEILTAIFEYIDRNNDLLNTAIIAKCPNFTVEDKEKAYINCRTSEEEIKNLVKTSTTFVDKSAKTKLKTQELAIACMLLASYFLNNGDKEACKYVTLYRCLDLYSYMHNKYAMHGANENVMAYTVANMSGAFGIKKYGSILGLLEDTVETLIKTYSDRIRRCSDDDIEYFCTATFTRLNIKMKKIFNQYYKNYESGAYLNMESESMDPNDFRITSSDSKIISTLVDKSYMDFINNTVHKEVLTLSVLGTDITTTKLESVVNDMRISKDVLKVRYVLANIVAYAVNYSNLSAYEIGSGKFIEICKKGYTSNTISDEMGSVKDIIEKFVIETSSKHGRQRYGKTAMNNYKKAVYMYFVYLLYTNAK